VRWIKEFFDIISVKLTKQLLALGDLRPDRKERWVGELNTSFDVWIVSWMWFVAPLVHSESLADQYLARDIVEGLRVEVEKETGTADPYRLKQDEITLAFPRVIKIGPPVGQDVSMADFIFWLWMVLDIHRPIIEVYGRYPYKNAELGRASTEEEKSWSDATVHAMEVATDSAEKIKEDVLARR